MARDETRDVTRDVAGEYLMSIGFTIDRQISSRCIVSDRIYRGTNCVEWTGAKYLKGYGEIAVKRKPRPVHRLAFAQTKGDTTGLFVCHACDNPPCCNPAHLFLGTNLDNMKDCAVKGRTRTGESHGQHKLTAAQVVDMRRMYRAGWPLKAVSDSVGVSFNTAKSAISGKTWRHVKETPIEIREYIPGKMRRGNTGNPLHSEPKP